MASRYAMRDSGQGIMAGDKDRYGVGEWFGHIVSVTPGKILNELAAKATLGFKQADMPCPFRETVEPGAKCNKKGGVCSLQIHRQNDGGAVAAVGSFITMCPSRFWQDASVFRWIGQEIIGTSKPVLIKEVDFLESVIAPDTPDDDSEEAKERDAVGRIDTVLVHPEKPNEWCALELQAVYFSGAGMGSHLAQYKAATGLVFPDKQRRPDFRSSGPKRLMPQLQTKVPHLSNSDIAWFVIDYDPADGAIKLHKKVFTTLESSVEALTAGIPKSREAFEDKLSSLQTATTKAAKKKIIRLS